MAYITATEQVKLKLTVDKIINDSKYIAGIIKNDKGSPEKQAMREGVKYYNLDHDITSKNFRVYHLKGTKRENPSKANNKVINSFHTELVDQKKDYIIGKEPAFTFNPKTYEDQFTRAFKKKFLKLLRALIINLSNKGKEWVHVYINEDGEFDYTITPAEQIIPSYDENGNLDSILRYYEVDYVNEKSELKHRLKVEVWTPTEVYYYIEIEEGKFVLDASEDPNPRQHWAEINETTGLVNPDTNFGLVPFICVNNNDAAMTDLKRIKSLIDLYDIILSAFGNEIQDLREIIIKIKDADATDKEEFAQMIRESGIIMIKGTGDAEALEVKIPVEAKDSILKKLEKNIYQFGHGVNFGDESFGGTITGVALKHKFAGLDLKANGTITELQEFVENFFMFYGLYYKLPPPEVDTTFNKSIIINETEAITNVVNSTNVISRKTAIANHPWVKNPDEEIAQIELEGERVSLDDENEGDDE